MGLPNMRFKLPSRNWMIFLTVTGTISAAVIYDKREKQRAQRKWSRLVEHLATEPLDRLEMPRTLTIFLEAPPSDGLRVAQDHFKDYVKPILVASGLDWEFVQGRKEGDIRAALAEKIRRQRQLANGDIEEDDVAWRARKASGIQTFEGPRGDIIIGRNTWKEYLRGLHEGWLGPLTQPPEPEKQEQPPSETIGEEEVKTLPGISVHSTPTDADKASTESENKKEKEKPRHPPPFISTAEYGSTANPADLPRQFDPSIAISFPHILGFLNTPTRLYRFFNRRHLADQVGRETAAIILAHSRPYHTTSTDLGMAYSPTSDGADGAVNDDSRNWEQARELQTEEEGWHKSVHKRMDDDHEERIWTEDIVLDPRLAGRMLKAELTPEDEERASKIVVPEEELEGFIKKTLRNAWREGKQIVFGGKPKHVSEELMQETLDED